MKKTTSAKPANLPAIFLLALIFSLVCITQAHAADYEKFISFAQASEAADVQQGSTQSLTEYISSSDNNPVQATLTAADGGNNVPAWLSVDGKLLKGISYTTNSEISFGFDATNLSVGTYSAIVTAAATGYTSAILDIYLTVTAGSSGTMVNIKVNFQEAATVPPSGWLRDYGQAFGLRSSPYQGSGYAFGWIKRLDNTVLDLTKNGRKRNSPSNILQATFMHMQASDVGSNDLTRVEGIWQCQVADGNYKVTVCVGDGDFTDSKHTINVEGVSAISNFTPTTNNKFKIATVIISVSDGYLSVDAKGGVNTKINYVTIQPDTSSRPSVANVNPQNSSINVNENSSISTSILKLPNSGVNNSTITTNSVYLTEVGTGALVPSSVNGTGGGDAITLVPNNPLKLSTAYKFTVTTGVKDLSDSAFIPYSSTFTTGSSSTSAIISAQFTKVALPNTVGQHSSLTIGPDGKLYALSIDGIIQRYVINSDGTLQNPQLIYTLQDEYGPRKQTLCIGLAFDPASTASSLIAWVTHSSFTFLNGPELDSKLSRLSGANLQNIEDIVINLPRSKKDHLTNSIAFGPDKALYFSQASNSAMGKADQTWGYRDEHLLSATCLRLDVSKINSFPLDAKTPESGGNYDPFAAGAPLTIYASGIRNAYDLLWHSNGRLYMAANGSAAGGNTPASVAGTMRPNGTPYNGPVIPPLTSVQQTQNDYLFRITRGGYYGHPNPLRGEYVMNGGNPTSPIDPGQVTEYPLGTPPDANYRGYSFNFQVNKSPNGIIEYKSNTFNGALKGKIMIVRYSQNNDIITLTPGGSNGDIVSSVEGFSIKGFTGFKDPLDLTEDTSKGNIYISEYGDSGKITLLRPKNISVAQKISVTLPPVEDSYTRDGSYAGTNYGTATSFMVKSAAAVDYTRKAYLKFSLSTTNMGKIKSITTAKLRVYGRNAENLAYIIMSVYGITNDTWTETGIKYQNAPSASPATSLGIVAVNNQLMYYETDVTNFVRQQFAGDRKVSFLLRDTTYANKILSFNSRENTSSRPQLVITGDSVVTSQQQRSASKAIVTNTKLAATRAVSSNTPVPAIPVRTNFNKVPTCDEPSYLYPAADTLSVVPVAKVAGVLKDIPVIENVSRPTLYPNPSRQIFHIRFPSEYQGEYLLQLINTVGNVRELGRQVIAGGGASLTINISGMALQPGVYFVRIFSNRRSNDILKLVVQY